MDLLDEQVTASVGLFEAPPAEWVKEDLLTPTIDGHETAELSKMRRAVVVTGEVGAELMAMINAVQRSERWVDLEHEFQPGSDCTVGDRAEEDRAVRLLRMGSRRRRR